MTRLFNLESYTELCSYAHLYNQSVSDLLPQPDTFPSAYKVFLHNYSKLGYLADFRFCQELALSNQAISIQNIGANLSGSHQIYIVPDCSNLLTLRSFLKLGEDYIYKSVYHYWNYFNQITKSVELSKPVIFIDLNSLTEEKYCLIQFAQPRNSPYRVPILNNRKQLEQDLLEFRLND